MRAHDAANAVDQFHCDAIAGCQPPAPQRIGATHWEQPAPGTLVFSDDDPGQNRCFTFTLGHPAPSHAPPPQSDPYAVAWTLTDADGTQRSGSLTLSARANVTAPFTDLGTTPPASAPTEPGRPCAAPLPPPPATGTRIERSGSTLRIGGTGEADTLVVAHVSQGLGFYFGPGTAYSISTGAPDDAPVTLIPGPGCDYGSPSSSPRPLSGRRYVNCPADGIAAIELDGGAGDDRLSAAMDGPQFLAITVPVTLSGGDGADSLTTLTGGASPGTTGVTLLGQQGNDYFKFDAARPVTADGGEGDDRFVWSADAVAVTARGGAGRDDFAARTGFAADAIDAGEGDDTIDVENPPTRVGAPDTVTCGPGADVVRADRVDRLTADCADTPGRAAPTVPTERGADGRRALRRALAGAAADARRRLGAASLSGLLVNGLPVRARLPAEGRLVAQLDTPAGGATGSAAVSVPGRRWTTLAIARGRVARAGAAVAVTVRFSRAGRRWAARALASSDARRVRLRLRLAFTPAARGGRTLTTAVTARVPLRSPRAPARRRRSRR